jgi:hypothetical protein
VFDSKHHFKALIFTIGLWHSLNWFLTAETGPADADYRLLDIKQFAVHAIQVVAVLFIYRVFAASADEKLLLDERRAADELTRLSNEIAVARKRPSDGVDQKEE